MTTRGIVRAVLAVLMVAGGLLTVEAGPAFACSCRAEVPVEEFLSHSDGAFVGVFTGRDVPPGRVDVNDLGRPVVNHFQVERTVKGDIGRRVDVQAEASGASCGLELEVGERTGLFLFRDAGGWTSGLCAQVEPQALLAFAPAAAGAGVDGGLILLVGLLVLAVLGAVVLEAVHRRAP